MKYLDRGAVTVAPKIFAQFDLYSRCEEGWRKNVLEIFIVNFGTPKLIYQRAPTMSETQIQHDLCILEPR